MFVSCDECYGPDAESVWRLAAVLHDEAHGDDRTPFALCVRQSCADLKDEVHPGWREYRPAMYRIAV